MSDVVGGPGDKFSVRELIWSAVFLGAREERREDGRRKEGGEITACVKHPCIRDTLVGFLL